MQYALLSPDDHLKRLRLQHCMESVHVVPFGLQCCASALLAKAKQAIAIPARRTPNFFSAARVTDWARLLEISSNWLFILSFQTDLARV
jgi:hypothetical protein